MPARSAPGPLSAAKCLAAALLALAAALALAVSSCGDDPAARRADVARDYAAAWQRGDYAAMRALLAPALRREVTLAEFRGLHEALLATATAERPPRLAGPVTVDGDVARVPLRVATRAFGAVRAAVALPIALGDDGATIAWRAHMAFPGLRRGDRLRAATELPPRAALLAADGGVLAQGPERTPAAELADVAAETVGIVGEPEAARAAELRPLGVPEGAAVGINGLERALDDRLRGTAGGRLLAGDRVLAERAPVAAGPVRTTIVPSLVRVAAAALAGRDGGAVALDPRSGALLAVAGTAFSGLGPPGSTFKIVTLAAALESGATTADEVFPYETEATLDGAPLQNADGESCGGSLVESFAHSCNSVFAPLGARVGADRLAAVARRLGFDAPPEIAGAATSRVPDAADGDDALTVGSTAIGQGEVQASALQMASVAATVARGGTRAPLTLDAAAAVAAADARPRRALPAAVTATIQEAMRAVVEQGTGTAAAIDGLSVAGKTGTAELGVTQNCDDDQLAGGACDPDDPTDTDAWFVGYAPADEAAPRVAVAVVLHRSGAGGATAAPAARDLIAAALERR